MRFVKTVEQNEMEMNQEIARKVLDTVDAGLVKGVGRPTPGSMCVEAAVCYAMGLPHGDNPSCVSPALLSFKISLNDKNWSSNECRARGLRRLALIQLGSAGHLDDKEFVQRLSKWAISTCVPFALRAAASVHPDHKHKAELLDHAARCEREASRESVLNARSADAGAADAAAAYAAAAYADAYAAADAAAAAADAADAAAYAADAYAALYAADAAAYAADAAYAAYADAARDKALSKFAEDVVQILVEMNVPGVQWLELAPLA